jgi:hypothetical protein
VLRVARTSGDSACQDAKGVGWRADRFEDRAVRAGTGDEVQLSPVCVDGEMERKRVANCQHGLEGVDPLERAVQLLGASAGTCEEGREAVERAKGIVVELSRTMVFDAHSGREQARHAIGAVYWPTLSHLSDDGATFWIRLEAGGENYGTLRGIDLKQDDGGPLLPDDAPSPMWHSISVRNGLLHVRKESAGVEQLWDPRTLRCAGPDVGGAPALPSRLDVVGDHETLILRLRDTDAQTRTKIGTLVPMADGLAIFFEDGTLELVDVPTPPPDLVCAFGNVLAPFDLCRHLLVEGAYQARVAEPAWAR